jgi:hypothetical protein
MDLNDENEGFNWERAAFVAVARQLEAVTRIYLSGNKPMVDWTRTVLQAAYDQATVEEVAAGSLIPMAYE